MQCLRFQAIQRRGISTAGRALDERNPVIVTTSRWHMCFRNRRGGEYVDPAATLSAACARDAIPDIPRRLLGLAAGFESESGRELGRRSPREDEPTLRVFMRQHRARFLRE